MSQYEEYYALQSIEDNFTFGIYDSCDEAINVAKGLDEIIKVQVVNVPLNCSLDNMKKTIIALKEQAFEKFLEEPSEKFSEQLMKDLIKKKKK